MANKEKGSSHIFVPTPLGAQVMENGVQFTIFSRHATRVWLMLFDASDALIPSREIELSSERNRVGDVWHVFVPEARVGQCYLYRMAGPSSGEKARFYNPSQWLMDPYAKAVTNSCRWGHISEDRPEWPLLYGDGFPKCIITKDDFDWSEDRRLNIPLCNTIIYEAHLRGYTNHPNSGVSQRGTYAGLIEKIPYLQDLGVTAVELLPVQEFNETEFIYDHGQRNKLRNLWGYSTQSFFAPMSRYAHTGVTGQQVREIQELILALHKAGIEVFLDVVFNHTSEGGSHGVTTSFRGIDNYVYYMMEKDSASYQNFTGCGNTVNCNNVVVRNFILDCLRYWRTHFHIDGFRFDLASILTRDKDGKVLVNPPLIEEIAEDPLLRDVKLIAEAWDAGGLYHVGTFPSPDWSEWNGRYRDDMRRFWRGDQGMLRSFVTRLIGSPDLYARDGQYVQKSINYVTCHDGFTLNDLVSYNHKHNEANGEANRDGENNNYSCNYGHEGLTDDPRIQFLRRRHMKNLLATLMLSQGVPMLLAGDEFARTQWGNNNAYCQDNEISWIDWSLLDKNKDLYDFVKKLIALRKAHPSLRRRHFLDDQLEGKSVPHLQWFAPEGHTLDWDHGQAIACMLSGHRAKDNMRADDNLFMVFNASEKPLNFNVPRVHFNQSWVVVLTTQEHAPEWHQEQRTIHVDGRSINMLAAVGTPSRS